MCLGEVIPIDRRPMNLTEIGDKSQDVADTFCYLAGDLQKGAPRRVVLVGAFGRSYVSCCHCF